MAGKPLCAMHGDNTGVYQVMNQLAWFNDRLGDGAKAALLVNGKEIPFETSTVGESRYVDATVAPKDGIADFELSF